MSEKQILLGFEVDSGKPVHLPLHHTGFTGMTQKAGKTTGIEAASMRSGSKAITFRTRRGEVGFETTGVEIPPFFVEHSDWQYVESLIEATLREKQRFNRSWIIRSCEGTKTLNEVWQNIKVAKKKAKGLALSVYTNLDAYFKIVVPEIRRYSFSRELQLAEGSISVMNLIGMPTEVQALVIRSVIDYIHKHERNVIIVIPEAWKFIGPVHTPVTYAAEKLIREGASIGNYLFIDSQDIAGIEGKIRGQIDNWILGRQKYEHEVDRTLKAIPIKNKPRKEQVQTLKLGHFFAACDIWVKQIYILPWEIPEEIGIEVAKGNRTPESVRRMLAEKRKKRRGNNDLIYKEKFETEEKQRKKLEKKVGELEEKLGQADKRREFLEKELAKADKITENLYHLKRDAEAVEKIKEGLLQLMPVQPTLLSGTHGPRGETQVSVGVETTLTAFNVTTNREVLNATQDEPQGQILLLAAEGWCDEQRSTRDMRTELNRRFNSRPRPGIVETIMADLAAKQIFDREKVVGKRGGRPGWMYRLNARAKELIQVTNGEIQSK